MTFGVNGYENELLNIAGGVTDAIFSFTDTDFANDENLKQKLEQAASYICAGMYSTFHYENMPMQYTAIFNGVKNDNFQMKNCDIILIFAQHIDCGYMLEPPH